MIVLSHRGNTQGRSAGENSMAAFERALAGGVDGIETDVRHLADGSLVLYHDRLSPSGKPVSSLGRGELAAELGHPVATPEEALASWPRAFWNFEIKTLESSAALLALLRRLEAAPDRLLLTSFRHDLVAAAAAGSGYRWGIIQVHRPRDPRAWAKEWRRVSGVAAMVWDFDFLDPEVLAETRRQGFDNYCYGMQSPSEHRACRRLPLAGCITDHVAWLDVERASASRGSGEEGGVYEYERELAGDR